MFVLLSLHPSQATLQRHISQGAAHVGGTDNHFQAHPACGNHMPHKTLYHVCIFRKPHLTTAALRRKSCLSAARESCHYSWTCNVIIRGYKMQCCQIWSNCRRGVIISVQSSFGKRHNISTISSMRHIILTWISWGLLIWRIVQKQSSFIKFAPMPLIVLTIISLGK